MKENIKPLKPPAIASIIMVIAIIEFVGALLGLLFISSPNADETQAGWLLLASGLIIGTMMLGLMTIVERSHESAYHLRNIQKLLEADK